MTCEALWHIEFDKIFVNNEERTLDGYAGIIVFNNGKIYGGDTSFSYIGEYQLMNDVMAVMINVKRFNDILPVLYQDDYKLILTGKFNDKEFYMSGKPDGDSNCIIAVRLTKIEEIL